MAIDAVILWVDGTDKAHTDKLTLFCKQKGISLPRSAAPTRYNQCGEIYYCIHSILRFAPWIRSIYIVSDGQTPAVVKQLQQTSAGKKLIMVEENSLFTGFEGAFPTFNSITLETLLWKIPNLSDRFIYFNDDWSIIKPVTADDFFRQQKTVLRGLWKTRFSKKWMKCFRNARDPYTTFQENSALLAGYKRKYFHLPHAPLPAFKKTFIDFFQLHPDSLGENIRYPFRDEHQFLPLSLTHHLEIKQGNALIDNTLEVVYINPASHSLKKIQSRLANADQNINAAFVCVQSLDCGSDETRDYIFKWLASKIEQ